MPLSVLVSCDEYLYVIVYALRERDGSSTEGIKKNWMMDAWERV